MFYTITYGVTLGIALADNILTMYFFYELLTLVTVPLVMHTLTREAILASRKYLYYSLGGAAFAFIGMIFVIVYGTTTEFVLGGVLDLEKVGGAGKYPAVDLCHCFYGLWRKSSNLPLQFMAASGRCGADSGYRAAACGSGSKSRGICNIEAYVLQLWR